MNSGASHLPLSSPRPLRSRVLGLSSRALWALLVALHLAPLAATTASLIVAPSPESAINATLLIVATAAFTAKALGRRLLPRCRTWIAAAAFLAITAIAHAEMAPGAAGSVGDAAPAALLATSAAVTIAVARRARQRFCGLSEGLLRLIDTLRRLLDAASRDARHALLAAPLIGTRVTAISRTIPALLGRAPPRCAL